jgi:ATPase family associated with various cellular activities (AAA)
MPRVKRQYTCFKCHKLYTYETGTTLGNGIFAIGQGTSIRQAMVEGRNDNLAKLHPCKLRDNIFPDTTPDVTPMPEIPIIPEPEPLPLPVIPEPVKPTVTETIPGSHRQLPTLLKFLKVRVGKERRYLNIMLTGPAGTGKTTVAKAVADYLGLKFFAISVGPQSTKSDFFGYTDAYGKPVWTVIRDAYVNGGVLLIDEMDAATAGALTYLNAILANEVCAFPVSSDDTNKTNLEVKHAEFIVIAGTNTHGKGASSLYNSRVQLDGATLDRFVGINWQYDTDLERALYPEAFTASAFDPTEATDNAVHAFSRLPWGNFIWALRRATLELNLRLVYGTRKLQYGQSMLNAGIDRATVENAVLWFGVSPNEKALLLAKLTELGAK